jgi:protein-S-isoprenylcysteine O-methyltransferase Ste14
VRPTSGARLFVWTGAALFVASLGYFLFSYIVTFNETAPAGSASRTGAIVNVALFSAFALHHSIFARTGVRKVIARIVSPELERSLYVWVASLMLIAVCALWRPLPGVAWALPRPLSLLLWIPFAAGLWLSIRGAAIIDVWQLAGVRGRTELQESGADFRSDGPYGLVRHPIYLGWVLLVFSISPMTTTKLAFAVISTIYLMIAIPFEERTLSETSGGAYDRYKQTVRWRMVPGVY